MYVHTTRLRHQVIGAIPDFIEVNTPSNRTDLAFDQDVSQALKEMSHSFNCEAMVLVKAAKILRKHILNMKFDFTGSLSSESEVKSVPSILVSFQPDGARRTWDHEGEYGISCSGINGFRTCTCCSTINIAAHLI